MRLPPFSGPLLFPALVLPRVEIWLFDHAGLVDLSEMVIAQDDRISVRGSDVVPRIVGARLLPATAEERGSASVADMVWHDPIMLR